MLPKIVGVCLKKRLTVAHESLFRMIDNPLVLVLVEEKVLFGRVIRP